MEVELINTESIDSEMIIDYGIELDQPMIQIEPEEASMTIVGEDEEMKEESILINIEEVEVENEILPESEMKEVDYDSTPVVLPTTLEEEGVTIVEMVDEVELPKITITNSNEENLGPVLIEDSALPIPSGESSILPTVLSVDAEPFTPTTTENKSAETELEGKSINYDLKSDELTDDAVVAPVEVSKVEAEVSVEVATEETVAEESLIPEELTTSQSREEIEEFTPTPIASSSSVTLDNDPPLPSSVPTIATTSTEVQLGPIGCTCSSSTIQRPILEKFLLSSLDTTIELGSTCSSDDLTAPSVLLTFNNVTYCLFRKFVPSDSSSNTVLIDESLPILFTEIYDHTLYYDTIEVLIDALRENLNELRERNEEELVLNFIDIGISLNEDSIYTREISLADFDKIHIGCKLSNRLHLTLDLLPRFSTGFNSLARHVVGLGLIDPNENDIETNQEIIEEEPESEQQEPTMNDESELIPQEQPEEESSTTTESFELIEEIEAEEIDSMYNNDSELAIEELDQTELEHSEGLEQGVEEEEEEQEEGTGTDTTFEDGEFLPEDQLNDDDHEEDVQYSMLSTNGEVEEQDEEEGEEGNTTSYHDALEGEYIDSSEEQEQEQLEGEAEVNEGEYEYNDDELAELNSDDLLAVIEGVESDYVESEILLAEEIQVAEGEGGEELNSIENVAADEKQIVEEESRNTNGINEEETVVDENVVAVIDDTVEAVVIKDGELTLDSLGDTNEIESVRVADDEVLKEPEELDYSIEITKEQTDAPEQELEVTDENDLVIDYEEITSSSNLVSPQIIPLVSTSDVVSEQVTKEEVVTELDLDSKLLSPKRSFGSLNEEGGEVGIEEDGELKRPRLDESVIAI